MPKHVLKAGSRPPWIGLAAAVWIQLATGNAYNFPLYSAALKSVLGYNQQQLTILGVANDLGENVGILPGIACNKFPPWAVLLVGVILCFFGYGVIWLAVSQTVSNLPYWLLFLALCVGTHSCAWFGTAVLVTNMRNFPLSRGTVAENIAELQSDPADPLLAQSSSSANLNDPADSLLVESLSAANLGSFADSDDISYVEFLLAVGEGAAVKKKRKPRRGEDFKFKEAFIKADFWLLWVVYFLGVGSGLLQFPWASRIWRSFGAFCQVESDSSNDLDDSCTNLNGSRISSVCIWSEWNALWCYCSSGDLLWCSVQYNDSDSV
ncbi:hypothetical protein MLD38_008002 [Melastoma candidum]|uniref:Uncharacterized protein n=1 Tax=Melastoma candidum TaxID=119954 RepID=A0ACB9RSJ5_9MYRT|nr:hypothetical protein MLD38_008002 [Melastoma candidum]